MKIQLIAGLCVALCSGSLQAGSAKAGLTQAEQQLRDAVLHNRAASVALLERSVNINSGTMNFSGVKAVGQVFAAEFETLGFNTQWIDGAGFGRAGHLLASYGNRGPKILLIGHLDTVFATDSTLQKFEPLDARYTKGPGITDMKGGNVVMLLALQALRDAGVLERVQLRAVLTGDEENRGRPLALANATLLQAAEWADVALGFEDGDSNPKTAVVSRRGSTSWSLEVAAKAAHSSQIFRDEIGYGAIYEASRILESFRVQLASEPNLTFNPGVFVGGTDVALDADSSRGTAFGKGNVIARKALVRGDIRAVSPAQLAAAKQVMQSIVAQSLGQTSATLAFDDGYPPMAASDGNLRLLQRYSQASEDLGFGPVVAVDPRMAGAADISFIADRVDMALDGLGLMGDGGHTVNEIADMDTLTSQSQRAALLIYRLSE